MRLRRFGAAQRNESGPQSRVTCLIPPPRHGRHGRLRHRGNLSGTGQTQETTAAAWASRKPPGATAAAAMYRRMPNDKNGSLARCQ